MRSSSHILSSGESEMQTKNDFWHLQAIGVNAPTLCDPSNAKNLVMRLQICPRGQNEYAIKPRSVFRYHCLSQNFYKTFLQKWEAWQTFVDYSFANVSEIIIKHSTPQHDHSIRSKHQAQMRTTKMPPSESYRREAHWMYDNAFLVILAF